MTDCLVEEADEGSLNVVKGLVNELKNNCDKVTLVAYNNSSAYADEHITLNRLFISLRLARMN